MKNKKFRIIYQILINSLIILLAIMYMPILFFVIPILLIITWVWLFIGWLNYNYDLRGYGVVFGGLGSGKTTISSLLAKRKKLFSNVPYKHAKENDNPLNESFIGFNLKEYLDTIGKNNSKDALKGTFHKVDKEKKYEGSTVIYDDLALYLPNYMDSELKKMYPQIGVMFPIRRHLYNHPSFMMTIQDLDRIYKVARELQIDYYVKAVSVNSFAWGFIPILGYFPKIEYIYYSNVDSARSGRLPYKEIAILDKAVSSLHVGAGRALEKVYNAENGVIKRRKILYRDIKVRRFNSRYFHDIIFNKEESSFIELVFKSKERKETK